MRRVELAVKAPTRRCGQHSFPLSPQRRAPWWNPRGFANVVALDSTASRAQEATHGAPNSCSRSAARIAAFHTSAARSPFQMPLPYTLMQARMSIDI